MSKTKTKGDWLSWLLLGILAGWYGFILMDMTLRVIS